MRVFDLSALCPSPFWEGSIQTGLTFAMEDNSIKILWFTGGSFGGRMPLKTRKPDNGVGPSRLNRFVSPTKERTEASSCTVSHNTPIVQPTF